MPPAEPDRQRDDVSLFQMLIESLTDHAIYMMTTDGFISTWNAGARRIKGYEASEILGQHFSRFFSPEDQRRGLPQQILDLARTHGRYEAEGWRMRKDGRRFWALAVIEAVRNDKGELVGFGKVTRDITERHEAREKLHDSERRFRLLVDSVVDYAIYMLDASGLIVNWNAGATRIKGYRADEVIGSHFSKFYIKEERAKGLPAFALETAKREGKYETEGWRVRKDGGRFWASVVVEAVRDETGELIGFAKITRDITERRSAQDAIRESERQFRLLVSNVIDYAIYMLDPNGIVVSWNAGAQKIKGYLSDEIIGSHFSKFYTEEDRLAGKPVRALHAANSEGRFEGEGWRVRKDGSRFLAHVVIDAIHDESGVLVGFAKITRDITERQETQLALQRAQEHLAHSRKMDALGQLTGGIAHDFNNLLTIINGQARVLRRAATDLTALSAIEAIETTVQRGASLTRQLLGFSRKQALEPQPVDLAERLPGLRSMLATSLNANVQIITSVLPGTSKIVADPSELDLAIMNLVLNARDALASGGTITIAVANSSPPATKAENTADAGFVSITVDDTGEGMPPEVLSKVFDPFFTTKGAGKGTGLGLSQVYGFSHQSGGTVTIDSEPGKGTRVTIYLPVADDNPPLEAAPVAGEDRRIPARILVVEDNPDVTEVTSALIKQLGYTVRLAAGAAEALRALENEPFDLVFSDIMMPGDMDGVGLAEHLRKNRPQLPVILTSGSLKRVEEAQRTFKVLQKPYEIERLDDMIQTFMKARQQAATGANLVDLLKVKRSRTPLSE